MMIAHQRQRQIDDAPRDAAMAHQRPGQHEQRNGHQWKRSHRREQPLPEQRHRIGHGSRSIPDKPAGKAGQTTCLGAASALAKTMATGRYCLRGAVEGRAVFEQDLLVALRPKPIQRRQRLRNRLFRQTAARFQCDDPGLDHRIRRLSRRNTG